MCTGLEPILLGSAATGIAGTAGATAATTGLFGAAGGLAFAPALTTLGAVAGGLSAVSSLTQGSAQADIAAYNAGISNNNAIAAQQKAAYDEQRQREMAVRLKGTQRASAAAAGGELLDMSDVLDESAKQAEMDALAIRYGGSAQAAAARQQAEIYKAQAPLARMRGYSDAGSTLLTGAKSLMATR
jgi:hypothetical protein